ncbi:MAG: LysR family transcriptional regulator [Gammaproteobacteria bacterium]|nr:MAG: LysR family transcriptional regulator [Gammaproteobacteria bacterium]
MEPLADDLILFAEVIEAGSFSRAAGNRGLPKSTVSRRIQALERRLGERLLVRTTRRLAITEFGEHILEHARRLLDETESARLLAQHRQATPQGTLRVSLPPDFLQEAEIAPLLLEYSERCPAVKLELDLSPRRVDLIAERFDLAVRVATRLPDDATLAARRLLELHHGLYASPAYLARRGTPREPAELLAHIGLRLITSSGESQPWQLSRGPEHWSGMPSGPLAANSVSLQRTLAAHGLGIVALAERFAAGLVRQGLLARVLPDWQLPAMNAWAVTAGRRLQPARVTVFVEMLRAVLEQPPQSATGTIT